MKLDNLDIKVELKNYIQECIQKLNANYEKLRASLLHRESFKDQLLPPVESLINEFALNDKLEVKARLKKEYTEEQERSDREEEKMDFQEQEQDAILEKSYNESLKDIEAQLIPLREEQKKQKEKFEVLCHSFSSLMASLGVVNADLAENNTQLIIKNLTSEGLNEATEAGRLAHLMCLSLAAKIEKMKCEDGVTLRIQSLEDQRQQLQETTGAELIQRNAARNSRGALRLARQLARKDEGSPEEELLSAENVKTLQKQIQIEHAQLDQLKKALLSKAEEIGYAIFLEQIEKLDAAKIAHTPEHIALARIIPKMQHYRMLETKVMDKKAILETKNSERSVFVSACIAELERDNQALQPWRGFKKAAFFTAISSSAASLAAIGAFTLLISTPLVLVSSSFMLLAAASATTALVLHLYETRKEKAIAARIEQMKASEREGSSVISNPSLAHRVRLMDESIQKTSDKVSKNERAMQQIHRSASEVSLDSLTSTTTLTLVSPREDRHDDTLESERRSTYAGTVAGSHPTSLFFATPRTSGRDDDAAAPAAECSVSSTAR